MPIAAPLVIPGLHVAERMHSHVLQEPLVGRRQGVMLHYDDSSRDDWSLAWFRDPECQNGYTWVAMDDGRLVEIADPGMRTPHAGPCLTHNANSAYYGLAAATNGLVPVTDAQRETIIGAVVALFCFHGWTAEEVETRIVGHDEEAIWTAAYTSDRARWGTLGRKVDPTGIRPDHVPILSVAAMRHDVAERLGAAPPPAAPAIPIPVTAEVTIESAVETREVPRAA